MSIKWIKEAEEVGTATMFPNYLQANSAFINKFKNKYSALTGLDDETDQIVLKPLTEEEDRDPLYHDSLRLKISVQKSYIRFGNTKQMSLIASIIHVDVPKEGLKGTSRWDDNEEALYIYLGGGAYEK